MLGAKAPTESGSRLRSSDVQWHRSMLSGQLDEAKAAEYDDFQQLCFLALLKPFLIFRQAHGI